MRINDGLTPCCPHPLVPQSVLGSLEAFSNFEVLWKVSQNQNVFVLFCPVFLLSSNTSVFFLWHWANPSSELWLLVQSWGPGHYPWGFTCLTSLNGSLCLWVPDESPGSKSYPLCSAWIRISLENQFQVTSDGTVLLCLQRQLSFCCLA